MLELLFRALSLYRFSTNLGTMFDSMLDVFVDEFPVRAFTSHEFIVFCAQNQVLTFSENKIMNFHEVLHISRYLFLYRSLMRCYIKLGIILTPFWHWVSCFSMIGLFMICWMAFSQCFFENALQKGSEWGPKWCKKGARKRPWFFPVENINIQLVLLIVAVDNINVQRRHTTNLYDIHKLQTK